MSFLNPLYLWALLGVLVPIAIHLWSRKKEVIIKVGSIELFKQTLPKNIRTLRLNELLLLCLRVLILALVAVIISGPQIKNRVEKLSVLYLFEPSLLSTEQVKKLQDTINPKAARVLTDGFPKINNYKTTSASIQTPLYWQLIKDIDDLPSDSIVIFSNGYINGIKGKRPATSKAIQFVNLNKADDYQVIVNASAYKDSVALLLMRGTEKNLQFETLQLAMHDDRIYFNENNDSITYNRQSLPVSKVKEYRILICYNDRLDQERLYIEAAYRAIAKYKRLPLKLQTRRTKGTNTFKDSSATAPHDISIYLGVPPKINQIEPYLQYEPDDLARSLIIKGSEPNQYLLTERLNSENIIAGNLTEALLKLLPIQPNLEASINRFDKRIMAAASLLPKLNQRSDSKRDEIKTDLSKWFWVLLILTIVLERILAKYRKQ